jgi:GntR family transcriptional regulator
MTSAVLYWFQVSEACIMQIEIDSADGIPIYLQLVQQVRYLIATGRLQAGQQLPSVRKLSEQLVVNPNTIAKAYRELELTGIVATRPGSGVFVSETASPLAKKEQHQLLLEKVDHVILEARHLDINVEGVIQLVKQRAKALPAA